MTTSKINKGTVAFQTWIGCLLAASLLGTMAYWSGEEMIAIVRTEVTSIRSIFGEWPVDTAMQWWNWLRLDQIESDIVQQILNGSRGSDPLRALADQINRFFAGWVANAFGFVYLGFIRLAMCLQWMLFCAPLAVMSIVVGMLQREVNRQTFAFSSPYRIAAKIRFLKWTLSALIVLLVIPIELPPYFLLATVWLLAVCPGFLLAGLQKEI